MAASHVAASSWTDPASVPSPQPPARLDNLDIMMPEETPSPPSDAEGTEEQDALYGDGDDARSFIQPAISPVATRLTSPRVLAAERRAAAMERLQAGESTEPRHGEGSVSRESRPPQRRQTALARLPSPWHPGPRDFIVETLKERKPALTGVFRSSTRHRRATSMGDSALRRITKALDSVNLPSFSSSSFFSSTPKHEQPAISPSALSHSGAALEKPSPGQSQTDTKASSQTAATPETALESVGLQRTLSDDSALYHSLSRVSSFGDDDRFTHIREQVNVRIKAIRDSWDAPTFKLPSKCKTGNQPVMNSVTDRPLLAQTSSQTQ